MILDLYDPTAPVTCSGDTAQWLLTSMILIEIQEPSQVIHLQDPQESLRLRLVHRLTWSSVTVTLTYQSYRSFRQATVRRAKPIISYTYMYAWHPRVTPLRAINRWLSLLSAGRLERQFVTSNVRYRPLCVLSRNVLFESWFLRVNYFIKSRMSSFQIPETSFAWPIIRRRRKTGCCVLQATPQVNDDIARRRR